MSDLISRSKLQFAIKRNQTIMRDGEHYIRLSAVLEKLRIAPDIDAAPVVHARWKPITGNHFNGVMLGCTAYQCSACGRVEEENGEPYCHCGAKMDGGAEA